MVDGLRGYAILLVIGVHSLGYTPDLVWPIKRLLTLGFYGVQLFFLASAMTLLMSWHRDADPVPTRSAKFLIRRFFRIAPLYYLAVVFYWFAYGIDPEDFSLSLLMSSLLFYNSWSPNLIPTVPGWTPVPGGWSISVEFCFYFLFPFLATAITSLKRSLLFALASVVVMGITAIFGAGLYPEITHEARSNFLYYWPPNQLVVFSLGFVLYNAVKDDAVRSRLIANRLSADGATVLLLGALALLSYYGVRKFFDWSLFLPPTHLIISVLFLGWASILVTKPSGLVINSAIIGLGKVSFSAYILHFAVLKYVALALNSVWPSVVNGWASILYSIVLLGSAIFITRWFAELCYKSVEKPFIRFGKSLIIRIWPHVLQRNGVS